MSGRTDGRTDGHLTWVGARDACASKKRNKFAEIMCCNYQGCEERGLVGQLSLDQHLLPPHHVAAALYHLHYSALWCIEILSWYSRLQ